MISMFIDEPPEEKARRLRAEIDDLDNSIKAVEYERQKIVTADKPNYNDYTPEEIKIAEALIDKAAELNKLKKYKERQLEELRLDISNKKGKDDKGV